ncbi:VOC family protein [Conexibacter woesei]|uniref:VOC family protein n=1 Tax=Conexibacter woesei TaxID=191495 RepID=UPI0003FB772C|nr:VOC family protein [Conexibacter woesei]
MIALDHAGLTVQDLDAAVAFYGAAFGFASEHPFELGVDGIRGIMLRHPDGARLELFARPASAGGEQRGRTPIETIAFHGYGHFALTAPDLDAVFAQAIAAGATERVSPRPSPEPGVRFAFVADPEGNLVELVGRSAA